MKTSALASLAYCLAAPLAVAQPQPPLPATPAHPAGVARFAPRAENARHRPLAFVENQGQAPAGILWQAQGSGFEAAFSRDGFVLRIAGAKAKPGQDASSATPAAAGIAVQPALADRAGAAVTEQRISFPAANPRAVLEPLDPQPGKMSFFRGSDPQRWARGLPTYARLRYKDIYPGIDLLFYGREGALEYDFVVAPGANPSAIRLRVDGAVPVRITARGELQTGDGGQAVLHRPLLYQNIENGKKVIAGKFVQEEAGVFGFAFGQYDRSKTLVVDPTMNLLYSTYLGGYHDDESSAIALDAQNDAYILGFSISPDYPVSGNAYQPTRTNPTQFISNLVLTKFNASGTVLFSTFLGGSGGDTSGALVLDASGNAYLTGLSKSTDFPVTAGAYLGTNPNATAGSAVVAELSPDGSSLLYSTFFGPSSGSSVTLNTGIALYQGNLYFAGSAGPGLVTSPGAYLAQINSGQAAFVAVLNLALTGPAQLVASTYYGAATPVANSVGTGNLAFSMALDSSGNPWITGLTYTNNLPVTSNALQGSLPALSATCQTGGANLNSAAFLAKLSSNLNSLLYATYFSGQKSGTQVGGCSEYGRTIALDSSGNLYLTGETASANFPTTSGVIQPSYPGDGSYESFISKLNPAGTQIVWSTYFGGNAGQTYTTPLILDPQGNLWVGTTTQGGTNFPISQGAYQATVKGGYDGSVTELSPDGTKVLYSTYIGGSLNDNVQGLAIDSEGNAYVTGITDSTDFPVTPNALETQKAGGGPDYNGADIFFTILGSGAIGVISPVSGGNTGDTTVTISGSGFQTGATCSLVMGSTTITAGAVNIAANGTSMTCTFALNGAATGSYNIVVDNPNSAALTLQNAFAVQSGGQPQIWTNIVGRPAIRVGVPSSFNVTYGNSGTTTAYFTTVWIALPTTFQYSIPAGISDPLNPGIAISDQQASFVDESDSAIKIPLLIPVLAPGASGSLQLQLTDTLDNDSYTLEVYMQPAWFGSIQGAVNGLEALNQTAVPASPTCAAALGQYCLNSWVDTTAETIVQAVSQSGAAPQNPTPFTIVHDAAKAAVEQSLALSLANALSFATSGTYISQPQTSSTIPQASLRSAALQPQFYNGPFNENFQWVNGVLEAINAAPAAATQATVEAVAPAVAGAGGTAGAAAGGALGGALATNVVGGLATAVIIATINHVVATLGGDFCEGLDLGPQQSPLTLDLQCSGGTGTLTAVLHCQYANPYNWYSSPVQCPPPKPPCPGPPGCGKGKTGGAGDPNDKGGPIGDGSAAQYVAGSVPLPYIVAFENEATATLPAAQVVVTDQLDPTKVDLSTVSLGTIAFGTTVINVPAGTNSFNTTDSLTSSLSVRIQGSLNSDTGLLKWTFTSIDPTTGLPPTDPTVGFLPPDTDGVSGQGSVVFTVMPKKGLATGTQITNQATVVFDANAPINTPTWLNTIDTTPPTSSVQALPATEPGIAFNVSWSGTDVGSGIASYSIYVSDNGGAFALWQAAVSVTSATYTGQPGHTYGFYSIATDMVGNTQAPKSSADATTTVSTSAPPFTLAPTSANIGVSGGSGTITVTAPSSTASWTAVDNTPAWITLTGAAGGTGSGTVGYQVAANTGVQRAGTLTIAGLTFTITQVGAVSTAGLALYPVTPCRVADTRNPTGPFGGPIMSAGSTRSFAIPSSSCAIPSTAQAYSLNITVVPPAPLTYLTVWPTGAAQPYVSTLNSYNGATLANAAIVPAGTGGDISIYVSNATDVVIDINGYFAPPGGAGQLAFYPATPCRIADTRNPTGPFGGPSLAAGSTRNFDVPQSACNIPTTAQAYSLNMTVVPPGPLEYLTTWPAGQTQPYVSTLNALQGQIAANAAIVPAGANGSISVYVSDPSNVLVDINGYFAPPGSSGALYFYPVTPCRIADTRNANGTFGGPALGAGSTRTFPIPSSSCSLPSAAQAYSLNMTVVPPASLFYLSAWPAGQSQPVVSTLNDLQGQVVANAAIVPAGTESLRRRHQRVCLRCHQPDHRRQRLLRAVDCSRLSFSKSP